MTTRANRYDGRCDACGQPVPAGQGVLSRAPRDARWIVTCMACIVDPHRELPCEQCGVVPAGWHPQLGVTLCDACRNEVEERRNAARARRSLRVAILHSQNTHE